MKNYINIKMGLVLMVAVSTSLSVTSTELQIGAATLLKNTCDALGRTEQKTAEQDVLFDVCGSITRRQLDDDDLNGGYQNLASEESFTPLTISAQTSLGQYSSIASHINKVKKGSFGLASSQQFGKYFYLADAKSKYLFGGAAGDDDDLLSGSRLGLFVNTIGGFGGTDRTELENASDFYNRGVIAGVDYRILDNLTVGLAGGYSHLNLDFAQNIDVDGGGIEADSYNVSAYSTFFSGDFYVDGIFTYGRSDYDIDRKIKIKSDNESEFPIIDESVFATPEGEQFNVSLASGYDFHTGGLTYGPYVRVAYLNANIDGYREHGDQGAEPLTMQISDQEVDSLESIVGGQISYAFSQTIAVIVPHV